jgi:hypothetical protein
MDSSAESTTGSRGFQLPIDCFCLLLSVVAAAQPPPPPLAPPAARAVPYRQYSAQVPGPEAPPSEKQTNPY